MDKDETECKHCAELLELVRDVRQSATEFDDDRITWLTVQIDRVTWDAMEKFLPRTEKENPR
jgi:hypothetical protein